MHVNEYKTFYLQLVNQVRMKAKNYTLFLIFFHIGPQIVSRTLSRAAESTPLFSFFILAPSRHAITSRHSCHWHHDRPARRGDDTLLAFGRRRRARGVAGFRRQRGYVRMLLNRETALDDPSRVVLLAGPELG